jgi:streptomycin 6-kinase
MCEKHGVTVERTLGGSRSVCLLGVDRHSRPLVVKISPYRAEITEEAAALTHWARSGVVPLVLDTNTERGVLVLERIISGTPVGFPDEPGPGVSPAAVGRTLAALHTVSDVPPVLIRADAALEHRQVLLQRRLDTDPYWLSFRTLIEWAYDAATTLHRSALTAHPTLIHGDFQPKNLLIGGDAAVYAIDPIASLGDPCFDAVLWAVTDLAAGRIEDALATIAPVAGLPFHRCLEWAVLISIFEHRPTRRPRLAARVAEFIDARVDAITDTAAAEAWINRPR